MLSTFLLVFSCQVVFGLEILRGAAVCGSSRVCFTKGDWHVTFVVHRQTDDKKGPAAVQIQVEKPLNKSDSSSRYLAVGFSTTGQMGTPHVPVTACIFDPTKPASPAFALSVNKGYENYPIRNSSFENLMLIDPQVALINGVLVCSFSQVVESPSDYEQPYNILSASQYLVLASGPANGKDLKYHDEKISSPQIDFAEGKVLGEAKISCLSSPVQRLLTKIHAIIMIFGWWLVVPTAIFFARYFKQIWPEQQPFGLRLWFHFHRMFQLLAVTMVVGSFVVILVKDCGEWVSSKSEHHRVHTVTGLTAVIAIMIQPLISLFRCAPSDRKRPIYNWFHRIIGVGAFCCSCVAIWWARHFHMGLNREFYGDGAVGVMIFYFVALGLTAVALEVHMFMTEVMLNPHSQLREFQLKSFGRSKEMAVSTPRPESSYTPMWAHVRGAMLAFFILCAAGVTIALSTMIGVVP